jgi:Electron transfer flavoprotein, alpha subunit
MPTVLAVTENRNGVLRKVSFEVVTAARQLADLLGATVDAIVLSDGAVTGTDELGKWGADRVLLATHPDFRLYQPDGFAATVAAAAAGHVAVLLPASATGRDLAPRVAARLGVGCATDAVGIGAEGGKVLVTRPVYAGKALQRAKLEGTPAIVSLRPNTVPPAESGKTGAMVKFDVPAFTARVTVKEIKAPAQATLDVTEAPIVVSGGRGLKDPSNFKLLEELAAALGTAAVGASRAVVGAGWREHGDQAGRPGRR